MLNMRYAREIHNFHFIIHLHLNLQFLALKHHITEYFGQIIVT